MWNGVHAYRACAPAPATWVAQASAHAKKTMISARRIASDPTRASVPARARFSRYERGFS
jgi:hypothetical protein